MERNRLLTYFLIYYTKKENGSKIYSKSVLDTASSCEVEEWLERMNYSYPHYDWTEYLLWESI